MYIVNPCIINSLQKILLCKSTVKYETAQEKISQKSMDCKYLYTFPSNIFGKQIMSPLRVI